jgi:hypothetical protein
LASGPRNSALAQLVKEKNDTKKIKIKSWIEYSVTENTVDIETHQV